MELRVAQADESAEERCLAWLEEIARSRDLTLAPYGAGAAAPLLGYVDAMRHEMLEFQSVIAAAVEVAALNDEQLLQLVSNTKEHRAVVERTAAAIVEVERGAAHVAETAAALLAVTGGMERSTAAHDASVGAVLSALVDLRATIGAASEFAAGTESGAGGVQSFLTQLQRIARQARLLSINAAIEAAHLGDGGRGFVIVADQVMQLASSTADSARNVKAIHADLHGASVLVEGAIERAAAAVTMLSAGLQSARDRSAGAGEHFRALEDAVASVSAAAAQQSAALASIAHGVEELTGHAEAVSAAAERAAQLRLGDRLERLRQTMASYRLGEHRQAVPHAETDLGALPAALRDAAERLRALIDADQRDIVTAVCGIAVLIARNGYDWRAIAAGQSGLRRELIAIAQAVEQTAAGAREAGAVAQRMRATLDVMGEGFGCSIGELEHALEQVVRVRDSVRGAETFVLATAGAAEQAAAIVDLIDAISSETALLSLNAAIEAAHAGAAGSGFGVIAGEIRSLAHATSEGTGHIAGVIEAIAASSRSMRETSAATIARADGMERETGAIRAGVVALRGELGGTLQRAREVAGVVDQQLGALADVRGAVDAAAAAVESDSAAATDGRRLDLALLGMRAHALAARRPLGTVAERIRAIGLPVAASMDAVFERAVAERRVRLEDCFDTQYAELTGASIARLGRLFDVSKVPATGFDPPKFATRYDEAVEREIDALIDAAVPRHPAVKAMFAVDLNGYCFAHYRECRKAWTGDYATDLGGNRIKRFFEDELSLRCARVGLGPASDGLPRRSPYARFEQAGCVLAAGAERPWAIFTYARDTGVVYNDLSLALYARERRVGTIRIIYDADVA